MSRRPVARALTTLVVALAVPIAHAAPPSPIDLTHRALELDGVPVAILSPDLDRDGVLDLAVVVAGTRWGELGFWEKVAIDEGGAFADALTIVPALFDRRQVVLYRGAAAGFAAEPSRLELPTEVRIVDEGGAVAPLVAWTDDGVAEIVRGQDGALELAPRIAFRSLLAGSVDLLAPLGLAVDLDGDGLRDLMVPGTDGLAIFRARAGGHETTPTQTLRVPLEERLPGDARHYARGAVRRTPLPVLRDLDGDGLPDLLFRNHDRGWNELRAVRNLGGLRFGASFDPLGGRARDAEPAVVFVGDLDGNPGAEIVTAEPPDEEGASAREEMRDAKRPRVRYRVHRLDADLKMVAKPARAFELEGHLFGGETFERAAPARDFDGDGRVDLVPVRLDFSLFEAARAVAARRIKVGLEFGVHCQLADGTFRETATLAGELKVKLDAVRLGQLNSFAGDFDGDGRADYLRLGPGARAEIYLGRAGCRFAAKPDARVELTEEPADASLVVVRDLDGDGKSDLGLIRPRRGRDETEVASTLDLYLSRGEW